MNQVKHIRPRDGSTIRLIHSSLVGPVAVFADTDGIYRLTICTESGLSCIEKSEGNVESRRIADTVVSQLEDYFAGGLREFLVPLPLKNVTDFQRKVLKETAQIPFGEVRSYGEVADGIGQPRAVRAVGGALARNPIGIIIPCHRVVAYNGHLHGYSSPNGIATKSSLLRHEGVTIEKNFVVEGDF